MNKKQYIAPYMIIEPLTCVITVLWTPSGGEKPEPAPARNGEGSSVKLTKMYI